MNKRTLCSLEHDSSHDHNFHSYGSHSCIWKESILSGIQEIEWYSEITQRTYLIQVACIGDEPNTGYPVIYYLDGNMSLPLSALFTQSLARSPHYQCSTVLVGIGYVTDDIYDVEKRALDYLPHAQQQGAAKFYQCIEQEIKPIIEQKFVINKNKQSLFGHSFGGVFSLYTLFNHSSAFAHYLISSPSIWWNNKEILTYEKNLKKAPDLIRITCAEYEQHSDPNRPDTQERIMIKSKRNMIDNTLALHQRLLSQFPNSPIDTQCYHNENHASVLPRAIFDGLEILLIDE